MTKKCLFLALLFQEPLLCLNSMLSLLLLKQMHATAFQIACVTMALPAVSILSFYWSSIVRAHPQWQRSNLILATLLAPSLYFFAFLSYHPTYFILASSCFMLFWRGGNPALMEILKGEFAEGTRGKLYSNLFKTGFAIEIFLGPLIGSFLDLRPEWWRALFVGFGLLYGFSAFFYSRIPGNWQKTSLPPPPSVSLYELWIGPLKASWALLKDKKQFRYFQIGFFLEGFGLMISRPSIDMIVAALNVSYMQLFICRTVLKAVGILISARSWTQILCSKKILRTSFYVLSGFSLFYLFILSTWCWTTGIFLAYFIYGLAQSGSHLVWNLSGTVLSDKESSTPYSSVSVLGVGLRGILAPLFGACLAQGIGLYATLGVGFLITVAGAVYFKKKAVEIEEYGPTPCASSS